MQDTNTTLEQLRKRVIKFRDQRNWGKYNTIDNLLMSTIIELGELMEHFQWRNQQESLEYIKDKKAYDEVRFELADVFVYLITLADDLGVDISKAIDEKLIKQDKKYPVKKMLAWDDMDAKGKWESYKEIKQEYRKKN